jgi:hypothetical protein
MKTYTEKLYYSKILGQFVFSVTEEILVNILYFVIQFLTFTLGTCR